jgi:SAM-dependent methyltransferase
VTALDPADFDDWYEAIAASSRWDELVRQWLDLPETLESTGYLSGSGLREVRDLLPLGPDQHLVELGCGRAGYGLALVAESGARLTGVDFSTAALEAAAASARRLGLEQRTAFRLGEMAGTGLPDGSADAVLCVDAIHFAPSVRDTATECGRILRDGGRLVLTSWEPADPGSAHRLPARLARMDLQRDLADAGFVEVELSSRPDWHETEVSFWRQAAVLTPGDDPAVADLVDEATEFLPLADALRRVLVVARAGGA